MKNSQKTPKTFYSVGAAVNARVDGLVDANVVDNLLDEFAKKNSKKIPKKVPQKPMFFSLVCWNFLQCHNPKYEGLNPS